MAAEYKLQVLLEGDDRRLKQTLERTISDIRAIAQAATAAATPIERMGQAATKLRGIDALSKLQADLKVLEQNLTKARENADFLAEAWKRAGGGANQWSGELKKAWSELTRASQAVDRQRAAINTLSGALAQAGVNTETLAQSQNQLQAELAQTARGLDAYKRYMQAGQEGRTTILSRAPVSPGRSGEVAAIGALTAAATPAVREMERLKSSMEGAGAAAQKHSKSFNLMTGQVYGLVGAYISLRGAWLALQDTFKQGTQLEIINASLKFAIGNAEGAAREFDFLRRETDRLGISFDSAATQFAQLAAATRGTRLEGKPTREIFLGIAEAARAAGLANEQVEGTLRAVTQIASKGIVQYEELRGQLGDRLPAALRIAAQAMGVTQGELTSLIQAGKVTAEEFLPAFAKALREDAAPALDEATKSGVAGFSRLENAYRRFQRAFAEGGLMTEVVKVFEEMTSALDNNAEKARELGKEFSSGMRSVINAVKEATAFLREHWETIKSLVVAYIGLRVLTGVAFAFNQISQALKALNVAFAGGGALAKVSNAFRTAALWGGRFAAAISGVAGVSAALVAPTLAVVSAINEAADAMKRARENAQSYRDSLRATMAGTEFEAGDLGPSTDQIAQSTNEELRIREESLAKTEEYWRAKALLEAESLGEATKATKERLKIARDELAKMKIVLKDRLAIESASQKNLSEVQKAMTKELQAQLQNRLADYQRYLDKRKELEAQDKAFGEKAKEVEKKINAPAASLTKGTVLEPLGLKQKAEQAIAEGDLKRARELAEQALDALENLDEGTLATKRYLNELLQGIKEVYQQASEGEDQEIGLGLEQARQGIEEIIAKLEYLKNIPVGFAFDVDNAITTAQQIRDQIQAIFNTIKIPLGTYSTEQMNQAVQQNAPAEPKLEPVPGLYASGGPISGPGTERSDSLLARVSTGEYVVQAPSVRAVGRKVMDYINRFGKLPGFSFGGIVPVPAMPAFAGGGSVGTPVHLHIGGESLPMSAAPDVAKTLQRVMRTEVLKRGRR